MLRNGKGNSAYDLNGTLADVPCDLSTVMSTSASGTSLLLLVSGARTAAPGSDILAFYSNYESSVDIAALRGNCGPGCPASSDGHCFMASDGITSNGANYLLHIGTSMATPHVSAVAAFVRSIHPDWTPGAVRSWLKTTAQPIGSRHSTGAGMVYVDTATR